jgi:hypothetical protein
MELEQERYHRRYMGCLFCGDAAFCRQLNEILHTQLGQPICNIGDLDLSHTL